MSPLQRFRGQSFRAAVTLAALVVGLGGITGVTGVVGPAPHASAAVPAYCSLSWPGQVRFVWDGGGGDGLWSTGANWSNNMEPNMTYGSTGYVCIPNGASVTVGEAVRGDVQAIDVQGGATLTLATGSKLYVYGDQATRPSVLRATSRTYLSGALGGPGRIDLLGTLWWRSTANGASTITTRDCSLGAACGAQVVGPTGLLEVGNSGVVQVDDRGVNLFDQYTMRVRGQVRLSSQGYVAADRGTRFELAAKTGTSGTGTLTLANNGGYYEGRTLDGLTTLSAFVNGGRIVKSGGGGTSVIDATYSTTPAGRIQVTSGSLILPDGTTQAATVAAGRSFGNGRCSVPTFGCTPTTDPGVDLQNETFQVPPADTSGASVQVTEIAGGPADRIGSQVTLHATGLAASPLAPAVVEFRYDSSVLSGKTWRDIRIFRRADGSNSYVEALACDSQGRPPAGSVACVDRREQSTSSRNVNDPGDPAGAAVDVILVVRTTATSRWVAR